VIPALRRRRGPDLDAGALYGLLKLRVEVFVVEQRCPYPELDGSDLSAATEHFWLEDADGSVVSTVRVIEEPQKPRESEIPAVRGSSFRIGRVCTAAAERGRGHTARLMTVVLNEVGRQPCHLNAQTYLTSMYGRHGFTCSGPEFVEDGIAHVPMVRLPRE